VGVEDDIWVANMIGQEGTIGMSERPPIRYTAVRQALLNINTVAHRTNASIHMPRIGCGLAGGKWEEIQKIIEDVVSVDVYVYDL
jgi:O-acetyl-ADP-ribose deacetylase (regulator of RNase III)